MQYLIPIASGKGGVGKTLLSANLGIAIARQHKTVVLVDLDLGGSNLHTVLGIRNRHPGVGHFINDRSIHLRELVIPTDEERLFLIPGDGLLAGTANLPYWRKQALIRELSELPADFVIIDLGSGTSYNTLDFFLTSPAGLIVTTPDTTAILNAYALLKGSMFRMLQRLFPGRSDERALVLDFTTERIEGESRRLLDLVGVLSEVKPESGQLAREALDGFRPRVVMNLGRTAQDIRLGTRLRQVVRNNLDTDVEFLAYLPYDPLAARSAIDRHPTLAAHPECAYAQSIVHCARRLVAEPMPEMPRLFPDNEDLKELADDFVHPRETQQPER